MKLSVVLANARPKVILEDIATNARIKYIPDQKSIDDLRPMSEEAKFPKAAKILAKTMDCLLHRIVSTLESVTYSKFIRTLVQLTLQ